MPALSTMLSNVFESLLFRPVAIVRVEDPAERFRLLHMEGEGFKGVTWIPGQTVQIFLGNLTKRAYTPMDLDAAHGLASFLIYRHGQGPGSAWAGSASAGQICQVMRPKHSLDFRNLPGTPIFFGDETSLAAAQALSRCAENARMIFEVDAPAQATTVLERLGVRHVQLMEKSADGSHLPEVAAKLADLASTMLSPQWIFTGQARAIQSVRKLLLQKGLSLVGSKVKAYWSPGKTGMD